MKNFSENVHQELSKNSKEIAKRRKHMDNSHQRSRVHQNRLERTQKNNQTTKHTNQKRCKGY